MAKRHSSWWTEEDPHKEVWARVSYLEQQNSEMRADNVLYMNIVSNFNVDGSGSVGPIYWKQGTKIRRNVCAAACDTAASFIAANRTLPSYSTTKGNYGVRRKAEAKARVIAAQMWALKAWDFGVEAFYDGATCGTGLTHVFVSPDTGLPELIRVDINSVLVDAAEGRNPRSIYWVSFRPREGLIASYPKSKGDLQDSNGPGSNDEQEYGVRIDTEADMVKVISAWHLGVRGKPGRFVITTSNATLVDTEYNRPRFPFAKYDFATRRGNTWHGCGMVERTLPAQLELAEIDDIVRKCGEWSAPVFLIEENSNVQPDDLSNLPGDAFTYQGTPPQMVVWEGTPRDLVARAQALWTETLEEVGLAPGVVGGELVQKGLGSARAVRAADDVSSRRHVLPTRQLESYYLQLAQCISDANDEALALDPDYEVKAGARQTFFTTSKWADLALPEGDATLTVLPMSAIPTTVQAKLATVEELVSGGYVSRSDALALMEYPDTGAWSDTQTSSKDLCEWMLDQIRDGVPQLPIGDQDLQECIVLATSHKHIAIRMEAPEEIISLFDDYIAYAQQMLDEAQAAMAPEVPMDPEAMAPEMSPKAA